MHNHSLKEGGSTASSTSASSTYLHLSMHTPPRCTLATYPPRKQADLIEWHAHLMGGGSTARRTSAISTSGSQGGTS
jgi:hypothetical protein